MNIDIRNSFVKDAGKLPASSQQQLALVIEFLEKVKTIQEIPNCKKLSGHKTAYRIRMGQYRIGFYHEKGIIELVRVLNRKDIYRYFP